MRVPFSKIKTGRNVFTIDWPAGALDQAGEGQRTTDRIQGGITVLPLSESVEEADFLVEGRIKTRLRAECGRCLEEFNRALDLEFKVILVQNLGGESQEKELRGEELNFSLLEGRELDLKRIVMEQVILDSDMVALCSHQCKGLCPSCGCNLNLDRCECKNDEIDPRLAALADWGADEN